MSTSKIYEGYLCKLLKSNKWKPLYFVIYDDRTLCCFKNKSHANTRKNKKETIYLTQIQRVEVVKHNIHNIHNNGLSILNTMNIHCFVLVSKSSKWMLSTDSKRKDLTNWIILLQKLSQGPAIHNGYLNGNKYFTLYQNRVLHYCKTPYSNKDIYINLEQCVYLRYDQNYTIEIGLANQEIFKQNIVFMQTENKWMALEWYKKIKCLLYDNTYVITDFINKASPVAYINGSLPNGFIVLHNDSIVFGNKKQLDLIAQYTFFNKETFCEYLRKKQCISLKLKNVKIRNASRKHGKYAFVIQTSKKNWFFSMKSKAILFKWISNSLKFLCSKFTSYKNTYKLNYHKGYIVDDLRNIYNHVKKTEYRKVIRLNDRITVTFGFIRQCHQHVPLDLYWMVFDYYYFDLPKLVRYNAFNPGQDDEYLYCL
eukprot:419337_1